ncbi:ferrochelatase, partial [Rhodococcus hoagii]|nr:ferrochelatase [Prescottella equi]
MFTAHSVPLAADENAGRRPRAATSTAGRSPMRPSCRRGGGHRRLRPVWQSRSGPPQVPWLGPRHLRSLDTVAASGAPAVIVCPVGFVSDHLEV